jgi:hypothetical protein
MFGNSKVKLPETTFHRAVAAAKVVGYSSVDEFVTHAVEKELERLNAAPPPDPKSEIEKQLRGLGYIE